MPDLISEEKLEVIQGSAHKRLHVAVKEWPRKWPTQLKSSFRKHAREVWDCPKFRILPYCDDETVPPLN
jgi:hypothetical protein